MRRVLLMLLLALAIPAAAEEPSPGGADPGTGKLWLQGATNITTNTVMMTPPCWIASIGADNAVTVDWACVEATAARYKDSEAYANDSRQTRSPDGETDRILRESARADYEMTAWSLILQAVRAGRAKSR